MEFPYQSGYTPERRSSSIDPFLVELLNYYKKYLENIPNPGSRRAFLLATQSFKNDFTNNNITLQSRIRTIDQFFEFIENVRKAENESGIIEVLKRLQKSWQEERLKSAKRDLSGYRKVESSILGEVKGKGVETAVIEGLLSLNERLGRIKFIKAPTIDDFIGSADIYMTFKKSEEKFTIFAIDISSAINKEAFIKKVKKEEGNYPLSLYFCNQDEIDIYRVEFALNDESLKLSWEDIEKIISISISNVSDFRSYLDRYKQDPRYKNGMLTRDFLEIISYLMPTGIKDINKIKSNIASISYLFLLKNILNSWGYVDYANILEEEIENLIKNTNESFH